MRSHVIPQRARRRSIDGQAVLLLVLADRRLCSRPEPTVNRSHVVASSLEFGLDLPHRCWIDSARRARVRGGGIAAGSSGGIGGIRWIVRIIRIWVVGRIIVRGVVGIVRITSKTKARETKAEEKTVATEAPVIKTAVSTGEAAAAEPSVHLCISWLRDSGAAQRNDARHHRRSQHGDLHRECSITNVVIGTARHNGASPERPTAGTVLPMARPFSAPPSGSDLASKINTVQSRHL